MSAKIRLSPRAKIPNKLFLLLKVSVTFGSVSATEDVTN